MPDGMQEVGLAIVDERPGPTVWGLFADGDAYQLGMYDGEKTWLVRAREVILQASGEANFELAAMVGCALDYDAQRASWRVRHDAEGRTSLPGLFVAGDPVERAATAGDPVERAATATDEELVCHCEGVTRDAIISVIDRDKVTDPNDLKRLTRAGMGVCQGRDCRSAVARLLAARTRRSFGEIPLTTFRAPVHPIPLAALATEDQESAAAWEEWAPGVWRRT